MSKKITIIFSSLAVILIVLGLFFKSQKSNMDEAQAKKAEGAQYVREYSYAKGNLESKVTVVEFYDPECEACKAFHPIVSDLMNKYGEKIKFVVRPMALHGSSDMAIRLTYAVGKQGKFFEMFNLLFEKQDEWGHKQYPPLDLFMKYAASVGTDATRVRGDMDLPEIREMMGQDMADANMLGVRGTPTFFINGKPLETLSAQGLFDAIELALVQK